MEVERGEEEQLQSKWEGSHERVPFFFLVFCVFSFFLFFLVFFFNFPAPVH